jgi:hypothetical protein
MVMLEDVYNNYDVSTLITVSSAEYNRLLLQNTQIFSKLHRMGGKYNTMIVPCKQLLRMVIVDDVSNKFDDLTLRTVYIEYNIIPYTGYTNILKST